MRLRAIVVVWAIIGAQLAAPALAQREVQSFEPSYFARFAPQTALDMLRQVPGFSVRTTGGGRGLGQGGANVLINGSRVTSKDTDVIDILGQSPARTVLRIEVADAASLGVTGLTGQVANVVIDRSRPSGSFEWEPTFRREVRPRLTQGSVSVSGAVGRLDYTLGLENNSWRGFERGPEERLDAAGNRVDLREERFTNRRERPRVTSTITYDFSERTSLNVTGSATSFSVEGTEVSAGERDVRAVLNGEDEWNADLSVELTHGLGPGALRLIGYQRYEDSRFFNRSVTTGEMSPDAVSTFSQEIPEGETITRAEYAWTSARGATWELAAETAYNFLEVDSAFTFDDGTGLQSEEFPSRRVEELRHQASLTRGFSIGPRLVVQASLAGEWSRISVDGDLSDREQTFVRPKGLVSVSYPWSDKLDIRGRVERAVGQLSFFDFVDSVDLTEDRDFAGNTDLVPQQSWIGELEIERRFGEGEKIIVRLVGEQIEDRIDRVLIDGQDAVGNIPEAQSVDFETEGTVLLDRWYVPGGRLDFEYSRFGSRLDDGVTGETRGFNGAQDWAFEVDFRQDIPSTPFAWGLGADGEDDFKVYRFNEIVRRSDSAPGYSAFVEHKDVFGLNLRISARNLANRESDLERVRFAGLRTDAPVEVIESRTRIDNRRLHVILSGTF